MYNNKNSNTHNGRIQDAPQMPNSDEFIRHNLTSGTSNTNTPTSLKPTVPKQSTTSVLRQWRRPDDTKHVPPAKDASAPRYSKPPHSGPDADRCMNPGTTGYALDNPPTLDNPTGYSMYPQQQQQQQQQQPVVPSARTYFPHVQFADSTGYNRSKQDGRGSDSVVKYTSTGQYYGQDGGTGEVQQSTPPLAHGVPGKTNDNQNYSVINQKLSPNYHYPIVSQSYRPSKPPGEEQNAYCMKSAAYGGPQHLPYSVQNPLDRKLSPQESMQNFYVNKSSCVSQDMRGARQAYAVEKPGLYQHAYGQSYLGQKSGLSSPQAYMAQKSGTSPQAYLAQKSGMTSPQAYMAQKSGMTSSQAYLGQKSGMTSPQSYLAQKSGMTSPQSYLAQKSGMTSPQSYLPQKPGLPSPQDPKSRDYRQMIPNPAKKSPPFPILEQRLSAETSFYPEYGPGAYAHQKYGPVMLPGVSRDYPSPSGPKFPPEDIIPSTYAKYYPQNKLPYEQNHYLLQMNQMQARLNQNLFARSAELPRDVAYVDQTPRMLQKTRIQYNALDPGQYTGKSTSAVLQKPSKANPQELPGEYFRNYPNLPKQQSVIQSSKMLMDAYPVRMEAMRESYTYSPPLIHQGSRPALAQYPSNYRAGGKSTDLAPGNISPRRTFQENMPVVVIPPQCIGLPKASPQYSLPGQEYPQMYPSYYPSPNVKSSNVQYQNEQLVKQFHGPSSRVLPTYPSAQYHQLPPDCSEKVFYPSRYTHQVVQTSNPSDYRGYQQLNEAAGVGRSPYAKKEMDIGKSLKEYLESWEDDEDIVANLPDVVLCNNIPQEKQKHVSFPVSEAKSISSTENECSREPQPLYILDSTNISSEALSQYLHIQQIDHLPANIKGYYTIPGVASLEGLPECSQEPSEPMADQYETQRQPEDPGRVAEIAENPAVHSETPILVEHTAQNYSTRRELNILEETELRIPEISAELAESPAETAAQDYSVHKSRAAEIFSAEQTQAADAEMPENSCCLPQDFSTTRKNDAESKFQEVEKLPEAVENTDESSSPQDYRMNKQSSSERLQTQFSVPENTAEDSVIHASLPEDYSVPIQEEEALNLSTKFEDNLAESHLLQETYKDLAEGAVCLEADSSIEDKTSSLLHSGSEELPKPAGMQEEATCSSEDKVSSSNSRNVCLKLSSNRAVDKFSSKATEFVGEDLCGDKLSSKPNEEVGEDLYVDKLSSRANKEFLVEDLCADKFSSKPDEDIIGASSLQASAVVHEENKPLPREEKPKTLLETLKPPSPKANIHLHTASVIVQNTFFDDKSSSKSVDPLNQPSLPLNRPTMLQNRSKETNKSSSKSVEPLKQLPLPLNQPTRVQNRSKDLIKCSELNSPRLQVDKTFTNLLLDSPQERTSEFSVRKDNQTDEEIEENCAENSNTIPTNESTANFFLKPCESSHNSQDFNSFSSDKLPNEFFEHSDLKEEANRLVKKTDLEKEANRLLKRPRMDDKKQNTDDCSSEQSSDEQTDHETENKDESKDNMSDEFETSDCEEDESMSMDDSNEEETNLDKERLEDCSSEEDTIKVQVTTQSAIEENSVSKYSKSTIHSTIEDKIAKSTRDSTKDTLAKSTTELSTKYEPRQTTLHQESTVKQGTITEDRNEARQSTTHGKGTITQDETKQEDRTNICEEMTTTEESSISTTEKDCQPSKEEQSTMEHAELDQNIEESYGEERESTTDEESQGTTDEEGTILEEEASRSTIPECEESQSTIPEDEASQGTTDRGTISEDESTTFKEDIPENESLSTIFKEGIPENESQGTTYEEGAPTEESQGTTDEEDSTEDEDSQESEGNSTIEPAVQQSTTEVQSTDRIVLNDAKVENCKENLEFGKKDQQKDNQETKQEVAVNNNVLHVDCKQVASSNNSQPLQEYTILSEHCKKLAASNFVDQVCKTLATTKQTANIPIITHDNQISLCDNREAIIDAKCAADWDLLRKTNKVEATALKCNLKQSIEHCEGIYRCERLEQSENIACKLEDTNTSQYKDTTLHINKEEDQHSALQVKDTSLQQEDTNLLTNTEENTNRIGQFKDTSIDCKDMYRHTALQSQDKDIPRGFDQARNVGLQMEETVLQNKVAVLQSEDIVLRNEDGDLQTEDIALQNEDMSLPNEDNALQNEDIEIQNEDIALQNVESTILRSEDPTLQFEDIVFRSEDTTTQNEDILPNEDTILQSKDTTIQCKDISLQNEDSTLQSDEDTILLSENTSLQNEDTILQPKDTTLHTEDISLQSEDTSLQSEDTTLQSAITPLQTSPMQPEETVEDLTNTEASSTIEETLPTLKKPNLLRTEDPSFEASHPSLQDPTAVSSNSEDLVEQLSVHEDTISSVEFPKEEIKVDISSCSHETIISVKSSQREMENKLDSTLKDCNVPEIVNKVPETSHSLDEVACSEAESSIVEVACPEPENSVSKIACPETGHSVSKIASSETEHFAAEVACSETENFVDEVACSETENSVSKTPSSETEHSINKISSPVTPMLENTLFKTTANTNNQNIALSKPNQLSDLQTSENTTTLANVTSTSPVSTATSLKHTKLTSYSQDVSVTLRKADRSELASAHFEVCNKVSQGEVFHSVASQENMLTAGDAYILQDPPLALEETVLEAEHCKIGELQALEEEPSNEAMLDHATAQQASYDQAVTEETALEHARERQASNKQKLTATKLTIVHARISDSNVQTQKPTTGEDKLCKTQALADNSLCKQGISEKILTLRTKLHKQELPRQIKAKQLSEKQEISIQTQSIGQQADKKQALVNTQTKSIGQQANKMQALVNSIGQQANKKQALVNTQTLSIGQKANKKQALINIQTQRTAQQASAKQTLPWKLKSEDNSLHLTTEQPSRARTQNTGAEVQPESKIAVAAAYLEDVKEDNEESPDEQEIRFVAIDELDGKEEIGFVEICTELELQAVAMVVNLQNQPSEPNVDSNQSELSDDKKIGFQAELIKTDAQRDMQNTMQETIKTDSQRDMKHTLQETIKIDTQRDMKNSMQETIKIDKQADIKNTMQETIKTETHRDIKSTLQEQFVKKEIQTEMKNSLQEHLVKKVQTKVQNLTEKEQFIKKEIQTTVQNLSEQEPFVKKEVKVKNAKVQQQVINEDIPRARQNVRLPLIDKDKLTEVKNAELHLQNQFNMEDKLKNIESHKQAAKKKFRGKKNAIDNFVKNELKQNAEQVTKDVPEKTINKESQTAIVAKLHQTVLDVEDKKVQYSTSQKERTDEGLIKEDLKEAEKNVERTLEGKTIQKEQQTGDTTSQNKRSDAGLLKEDLQEAEKTVKCTTSQKDQRTDDKTRLKEQQIDDNIYQKERSDKGPVKEELEDGELSDQSETDTTMEVGIDRSLLEPLAKVVRKDPHLIESSAKEIKKDTPLIESSAKEIRKDTLLLEPSTKKVKINNPLIEFSAKEKTDTPLIDSLNEHDELSDSIHLQMPISQEKKLLFARRKQNLEKLKAKIRSATQTQFEMHSCSVAIEKEMQSSTVQSHFKTVYPDLVASHAGSGGSPASGSKENMLSFARKSLCSSGKDLPQRASVKMGSKSDIDSIAERAEANKSEMDCSFGREIVSKSDIVDSTERIEATKAEIDVSFGRLNACKSGIDCSSFGSENVSKSEMDCSFARANITKRGSVVSSLGRLNGSGKSDTAYENIDACSTSDTGSSSFKLPDACSKSNIATSASIEAYSKSNTATYKTIHTPTPEDAFHSSPWSHRSVASVEDKELFINPENPRYQSSATYGFDPLASRKRSLSSTDYSSLKIEFTAPKRRYSAMDPARLVRKPIINLDEISRNINQVLEKLDSTERKKYEKEKILDHYILSAKATPRKHLVAFPVSLYDEEDSAVNVKGLKTTAEDLEGPTIYQSSEQRQSKLHDIPTPSRLHDKKSPAQVDSAHQVSNQCLKQCITSHQCPVNKPSDVGQFVQQDECSDQTFMEGSKRFTEGSYPRLGGSSMQPLEMLECATSSRQGDEPMAKLESVDNLDEDFMEMLSVSNLGHVTSSYDGTLEKLEGVTSSQQLEDSARSGRDPLADIPATLLPKVPFDPRTRRMSGVKNGQAKQSKKVVRAKQNKAGKNEESPKILASLEQNKAGNRAESPKTLASSEHTKAGQNDKSPKILASLEQSKAGSVKSPKSTLRTKHCKAGKIAGERTNKTEGKDTQVEVEEIAIKFGESKEGQIFVERQREDCQTKEMGRIVDSLSKMIEHSKDSQSKMIGRNEDSLSKMTGRSADSQLKMTGHSKDSQSKMIRRNENSLSKMIEHNEDRQSKVKVNSEHSQFERIRTQEDHETWMQETKDNQRKHRDGTEDGRTKKKSSNELETSKEDSEKLEETEEICQKFEEFEENSKKLAGSNEDSQIAEETETDLQELEETKENCQKLEKTEKHLQILEITEDSQKLQASNEDRQTLEPSKEDNQKPKITEEHSQKNFKTRKEEKTKGQVKKEDTQMHLESSKDQHQKEGTNDNQIENKATNFQNSPSNIQAILSNVNDSLSNIQAAASNIEAISPDSQASLSNFQASPSNIQASPSNIEASPSNIHTILPNVNDSPSNFKASPSNVQTWPLPIHDSPNTQTSLSNIQTGTTSIQVHGGSSKIKDDSPKLQRTSTNIKSTPANSHSKTLNAIIVKLHSSNVKHASSHIKAAALKANDSSGCSQQVASPETAAVCAEVENVFLKTQACSSITCSSDIIVSPSSRITQESNIVDQHVNIDQCVATVGQQPSTVGQLSSAVGRQAPTVDLQVSPLDQHSATVDHLGSPLNQLATTVDNVATAGDNLVTPAEQLATTSGHLASEVSQLASAGSQLASPESHLASPGSQRAPTVTQLAPTVSQLTSPLDQHSSLIQSTTITNLLPDDQHQIIAGCPSNLTYSPKITSNSATLRSSPNSSPSHCSTLPKVNAVITSAARNNFSKTVGGPTAAIDFSSVASVHKHFPTKNSTAPRLHGTSSPKLNTLGSFYNIPPPGFTPSMLLTASSSASYNISPSVAPKRRLNDPRIEKPTPHTTEVTKPNLIENKLCNTFRLTEYTKSYIKMKTGQSVESRLANGLKRSDPRLSQKPAVEDCQLVRQRSELKRKMPSGETDAKRVKINLQDYRNRKQCSRSSSDSAINAGDQNRNNADDQRLGACKTAFDDCLGEVVNAECMTESNVVSNEELIISEEITNMSTESVVASEIQLTEVEIYMEDNMELIPGNEEIVQTSKEEDQDLLSESQLAEEISEESNFTQNLTHQLLESRRKSTSVADVCEDKKSSPVRHVSQKRIRTICADNLDQARFEEESCPGPSKAFQEGYSSKASQARMKEEAPNNREQVGIKVDSKAGFEESCPGPSKASQVRSKESYSYKTCQSQIKEETESYKTYQARIKEETESYKTSQGHIKEETGSYKTYQARIKEADDKIEHRRIKEENSSKMDHKYVETISNIQPVPSNEGNRDETIPLPKTALVKPTKETIPTNTNQPEPNITNPLTNETQEEFSPARRKLKSKGEMKMYRAKRRRKRFRNLYATDEDEESEVPTKLAKTSKSLEVLPNDVTGQNSKSLEVLPNDLTGRLKNWEEKIACRESRPSCDSPEDYSHLVPIEPPAQNKCLPKSSEELQVSKSYQHRPHKRPKSKDTANFQGNLPSCSGTDSSEPCGGQFTKKLEYKCHINLNALGNKNNSLASVQPSTSKVGLKLTLKSVRKEPARKTKHGKKKVPRKELSAYSVCSGDDSATNSWVVKDKVPKVIIKRNGSGYCAVSRDVSSNPIWQPVIRVRRHRYIESLVENSRVKENAP